MFSNIEIISYLVIDTQNSWQFLRWKESDEFLRA